MFPALSDPWLVLYAALMLLAALAALVWPWLPNGAAVTPVGDAPPATGGPWAGMALGGAAVIYGWITGALQPLDLMVMVWIVVSVGLTNQAAAKPMRRMVLAGLTLAMATGIGSWALARPFLTGADAGAPGLLFGAGLILALAGTAGVVRRLGGTG